MGLVRAMQADGAAVLWPLLDPAGATAAADWSGNARNGTYTGVTPYTAAGLPGLRAPTWGSGQYIARAGESALNAGTGEFAFEFWVRSSAATGTIYELVNRDQGSSGSGQMLRINSASGILYTNTISAYTSTAPRITDGNLHHVVYQRRAGMVEIWQDATQYLSAAQAGDVNQGNSDLRLGPTPSGGQPTLPGTMAFFGYYVGTSLSPTRIAVHRAEGLRTGVVLG